jgi:chaperonin cofactor prefoldin
LKETKIDEPYEKMQMVMRNVDPDFLGLDTENWAFENIVISKKKVEATQEEIKQERTELDTNEEDTLFVEWFKK